LPKEGKYLHLRDKNNSRIEEVRNNKFHNRHFSPNIMSDQKEEHKIGGTPITHRPDTKYIPKFSGKL
jgi:hypothetical protein